MPMTVDKLKEARQYRAAGRLAFEQGRPRSYGPHFGLRSGRLGAVAAFLAGYDEARAEAAAPRCACGNRLDWPEHELCRACDEDRSHRAFWGSARP